jgi:RNA polymerase sigma-70 factor (ECF subfamily)
MTMDTSVSLLERLAGSPADDDWRRLLDLYQPLLRAWLLRAGVATSDLDDLAQEVLLVVVREVTGFDRRRTGSFRAWLRGILVHRVQDHFRACNYRPVATGDSGFRDRLAELASPDSALSREWDLEHDRHLAARAMRLVERDFAPATWQAFRLQVLDGLAAAEAAARLGLTLNAALLAKSRVLKRLRQELARFVE